MSNDTEKPCRTSVLPVDVGHIGIVIAVPKSNDILDNIDIQLDLRKPDAVNLQLAAKQLRESNIPVAFPTETVYGLGADATRSEAVRGIYEAKHRPIDNPLIVHFASLGQLRKLLKPSRCANGPQVNGHVANSDTTDPIPDIYKPLISKFWPGPLTIILPNPRNSSLAPEVTAGLNTFGARIPRHVLALALIQLADRPIAAPSANASTKPSPTAAEHVAHDLHGRIETIIDGGPCDVGVESTVVNGLSQPPVILRPGGVSLEQLRSCPGWENTQIGYKNVAESENQPKAPGMKYRHYSPRAPVILFEVVAKQPSLDDIYDFLGPNRKLGVITTRTWKIDPSLASNFIQESKTQYTNGVESRTRNDKLGFAGMIDALHLRSAPFTAVTRQSLQGEGSRLEVLKIDLGNNTTDIARGIFSALRELDKEDVDAIVVEGIDDTEGDPAAAVMNRLRKAAEIKLNG